MATDVGVANLALTLLGESRIISLDDDVKPAREAKAIFEMVRDALLGGYTWSFAKTRTTLPADATPPAFGYANQFQLPSDCLRIVMVNELYAGLDLTDYRGSPTEDFTIEGRKILTDYSAPLKLRYIKRITDPSLYQANFTKVFGCQLAVDLCEALTQSNAKKTAAEQALGRELRLAVRANAIELPPNRLADDDWIVSRL